MLREAGGQLSSQLPPGGATRLGDQEAVRVAHNNTLVAHIRESQLRAAGVAAARTQ